MESSDKYCHGSGCNSWSMGSVTIQRHKLSETTAAFILNMVAGYF